MNRSSKDNNFNTRMTIFPMKHQTSSCDRMIGTLTFLCTSNLDQFEHSPEYVRMEYQIRMIRCSMSYEYFEHWPGYVRKEHRMRMIRCSMDWECISWSTFSFCGFDDRSASRQFWRKDLKIEKAIILNFCVLLN
jgi:hypothetical protein